MKNSKQISAILVTLLGGAAIAMGGVGYTRMSQADRVNADRLQMKAPVTMSTSVPNKEKAAKVKRVAEDETPTLRGLVVSSDMPYVCEFKGEEGLTLKNIFFDYDMPEGSGGAFYANGKYYVGELYSPYVGAYRTDYTVYDAETWDELNTIENLLPSSAAYCATYDPMTDAVYGYFMNDEMESTWRLFGRMNLATGEVLGLNNVDTDAAILAIAAGTDGYLYGVNATGMFCRITKKGEITKLGHTDIKPQYVQSAAIDPMTGKFYWAGFTDEGEGGLYVVDPETYLASLVQKFPKNEEIIGLYVVPNSAEADMPGEVKDITIDFIEDSHSGKVSFTAPDHYAGGKGIQGDLTAHVAVDGNHFSKSVKPGESVTIEANVSYEGLYNFAAWVSDANTAGNKQYAQKWIGKDRPAGVQNLKGEVDGYKVKLSWEVPTTGIHGGYVNPTDATFIIDRSGYGNLYIRDYTQTTFEDVFDENVNADVRYSVRIAYNDYGSPSMYTEWLHIGPDVMSVPVSLSANSDYKKFIIIDANDDDNTWETSWSGCAVYNGGDVAADDWMLTPLVQLEAGRVYQLEYEASAKMGLFSPEIIEVKYGRGDTAEAMTEKLDYQEINTIGLMKYNVYTASFSVAETGSYRFGFHALSNKGNQMGLASIEIKELSSSTAGPVAPTALSVEAAPNAELKATVKFTLPAKDSDGNDLKGLSKVELYNGERLADSKTGVAPGEECSLADDKAAQGNNTYSVVAYGEDGTKGISASVSGWVGIDVPLVPENINLDETDFGATLSWELSETGENGGYVDPAQVIYQILDPHIGTEIAVVKGVKEVNLHFEKPNKQSSVSYAIIPSTITGSPEDIVVSPSIIVGPGYELPFHEHFAPASDYGWTQIGGSDDDLAGWAPEKETIGIDGAAGLSAYYGEYDADRQILSSGKISIPAGSDPTLTMWLLPRGSKADAGIFSIVVSEAFNRGGKTIFRKTLSESEAEWEKVMVSMKEFAGKDIFIALDAFPKNGAIIVGIDNLAIREAKDYDGAVENITIDTDEVEVSRKDANIQAWVANQGTKAMADGDFSVDFYAGDCLFASVPGVAMEPLFGYSSYKVKYEPTVDDSDPTEIYAKLSFGKDQNEANNISGEVSVYVVSPELPSASELTAEKADQSVYLKWTAADVSGKPVRVITDDFESYRTFDNNRAGKWTIIDEDQQPGVKVSYFFPYSSENKGWVVMEPGAVPSAEGTLADRLPAYSGAKYMAAYCAGDNKDWLITPELSGKAQKISFMARAESVDAGREMFEVYYSTTGTDIADFKALDATVYRTEPKGWSEFSFSVPEGAKYFAVRCVSHNRCAMHIDDFTFESAPTPVDAEFIGYNIYRNGTRLNDKPVAELSYLDNDPQTINDYTVRAVYDRGEAPASNIASVEVSGVELVIADIDASEVPVYDVKGLRVFDLTEGEIYLTRGKKFIYRKK